MIIRPVLNNHRHFFPLIILILFTVLSCTGQQPQPVIKQAPAISWTHFSIDAHLPGNEWGTGSTAPGDFDGDGDLDVALSRRESLTAYWYERVDDSTWVRHEMGSSEYLARALGSDALDIDRDGHVDAAINNLWFKNPGNLDENPDAAWEVFQYEGGGHDIVTADVDGDGLGELVTYDGKEVYWFDPEAALEKHTVGIGDTTHGGVAPHGVGDLDGDGDNDIVIPGYWFANPGSGIGEWKRHSWPHLPIPHATYGTSIRCWVADIDSDGNNDIVYSDCDTGNSLVYWCRNNGRGQSWQRQKLPEPPTREGDVPGTGSWHSLGVADFDSDGDLDIFAGEQEDSTMNGREPLLPMKTKGLKERGVIWLNNGEAPPKFTCFVIHVDNPGWHDARLGDVDGDGDIDIVSKVWNKDGDYYHADYWRNDTR